MIREPASSPTFHWVNPAAPFSTKPQQSSPTKRIHNYDSELQQNDQSQLSAQNKTCILISSEKLSLLISFPSSHFYLVFNLMTQLKQPPMFFFFLRSIINKWGQPFFPPSLSYTDKNRIPFWSRFEMWLTISEFTYSKIWDLNSMCKIKMDMVQH